MTIPPLDAPIQSSADLAVVGHFFSSQDILNGYLDMEDENCSFESQNRVQFSGSIEYFPSATCPYSNDDRPRTWYNEAEYKALRRESGITVRKMRKSREENFGFGDETQFCSRGLEHLVSSAALDERNMNKNVVIRAVLTEHNDQKAKTLFDSAALRTTSMACSARAREAACRIGASDAKAAALIHSPNNHSGVTCIAQRELPKQATSPGTLHAILDDALKISKQAMENTTSSSEEEKIHPLDTVKTKEQQQPIERKQSFDMGSLRIFLSNVGAAPASLNDLKKSTLLKNPETQSMQPGYAKQVGSGLATRTQTSRLRFGLSGVAM